MVMLFYIEKKDGNLIHLYKNGNKKNSKNNKKRKNINMLEELKVIYFFYL